MPSTQYIVCGHHPDVFTELHGVKQIPGEPRRRWFQSPREDLIVWYEGDAIVGFQLGYDRNGVERLVTWRAGKGLSLQEVDFREVERRLAALPDGLPPEVERFLDEHLRPGADAERRRIDAAAETVVNAKVLRDLGGLVGTWRTEEHLRRRTLKFVLPFIVLALVGAALLGMSVYSERRAVAQRVGCEQAPEAARLHNYSSAVSLLTDCLDRPDLTNEQRAQNLKLRAWAYARLAEPERAARDQEASFSLVPGRSYRDFLDYAVYLRDAGRAAEGLHAVLAAEQAEGGRLSMMTQYHKGWILHDLGRYREALEAFNSGILAQPSYAFVYWRRGLLYESLGEKTRARLDFEQCARLLMAGKTPRSGADVFPAIRAKLREYGLQDKYPI